MNIVQDLVSSYLPLGSKRSPSGWITLNCPMCTQFGQPRPDTRKRGGFMFADESVVYHCFNCGFKVGWKPPQRFTDRFKKLLKGLGVPREKIQRVTLEILRKADETDTTAFTKKKEQNITPDWPEIILPPKSKPIFKCEPTQEFIDAVEYVANRGLLDLTEWYYSPSDFGQMKNRIILPYKYKNKIVGYTARWIGEKQYKYPKYYQQQSRDFVFNLDAQTKERKYVIVVEGPFDAVAIDGVAIGGNKINYRQATIINQLNKEVIFVPDQDKPGMEMVRQVVDLGWSVSFPPWDEAKDCAEAVSVYGRLFTLTSILEFIEYNTTKIQVKAKQWK